MNTPLLDGIRKEAAAGKYTQKLMGFLRGLKKVESPGLSKFKDLQRLGKNVPKKMWGKHYNQGYFINNVG